MATSDYLWYETQVGYVHKPINQNVKYCPELDEKL